MKRKIQTIAGWANYPRLEAEVFEPANREALRQSLHETGPVIARGNAKSYGDAALAPQVISTLHFNRVLSFDSNNGVVECEAGVLLSDLLKIIIPAGWFFHVTPGIKAITVGGAIASDVHGKNHPEAGCFSNYLLSFELMDASGAQKTCSRSENAALFWQTCGGMGWTGIVLTARFSLRKIASTQMRQKTVRAENLENLFRAFEENSAWPYAAAWVDCTSKNWRGAAFFAEHDSLEQQTEALKFSEKAPLNIPFFAPAWLLNPLSIRGYNALQFFKNRNGERLVGLDQYFYPLDALQNWNRLYGRRGLVQYQFCLPEESARVGFHQALDTIRASGETPFLTVMKRHGERPPEAIHAFPIRGYSLALDFPRTSGIFALIGKLDEVIWAQGGKIYLTKDACSAPHMGRVDARTFGEEKFSSLLRERIRRATG